MALKGEAKNDYQGREIKLGFLPLKPIAPTELPTRSRLVEIDGDGNEKRK